MSKQKEPSVDAQDLKRALETMAKRIGKRKRITVSQTINLFMKSLPK